MTEQQHAQATLQKYLDEAIEDSINRGFVWVRGKYRSQKRKSWRSPCNDNAQAEVCIWPRATEKQRKYAVMRTDQKSVVSTFLSLTEAVDFAESVASFKVV